MSIVVYMRTTRYTNYRHLLDMLIEWGRWTVNSNKSGTLTFPQSTYESQSLQSTVRARRMASLKVCIGLKKKKKKNQSALSYWAWWNDTLSATVPGVFVFLGQNKYFGLVVLRARFVGSSGLYNHELCGKVNGPDVLSRGFHFWYTSYERQHADSVRARFLLECRSGNIGWTKTTQKLPL